MLRQLTGQDASFLYLETAETPGHVGGLSLVELPDGTRGGDFYQAYKALIASRLRHVPFMHSKLATLPLDLDRPFWVEDDKLDLDYHVRHLTAPAPGGMKELEELVALLHATLLDRGRPLWEFYVIDGLERGQVAIYTKVHHAAIDGAASQALVATMYDPTPVPRVLPDPAPDGGANQGDLEHIVEGLLAHAVRQEIRAVTYMPELFKAWADLLLPNPRTLKVESIADAPPTPRTPFNVAISNQRVYAARTLPLAVVKKIAKQTDTKINDVVLALCSGALRAFLARRGPLPELSLTALVPISVRQPADLTTPNMNGMYSCSLASGVVDLRERLQAIHRSSLEQRRRFEALNTLPVPDVTVPGMTFLGPRLVERYGRGKIPERLPLFGNLVISNVPGPQIPLHVAGARVLSMYPCSIPFHGSALNITVQSYCDRLDFGLIACRRALPDLAELADGLSRSLSELEQAVVHNGGQTHDDHDRSDAGAPAGGQAPAPGPARDDGEDRPPRNRHPKAPRQPSQGHRGAPPGQ